ncbi:MAG: hypothetical protein GTO54_03430 [Nitrososphaeria archaeon]|nr:hypothetical protein [Nitrososphaeria archaeon]
MKRNIEDMQRKAARFFNWISENIDLSVDLPSPLRHVCGVDVSYKGPEALGACVLYDLFQSRIVETVCVKTKVHFPYIPTLLFLREAVPMIKSISRLLRSPQLILVDANGILHPFRSGLACFIGLYFDKPTVGVAKKLLCGRIRKWKGLETVFLDDDPLGFVYKRRGSKKKFFVSPAHKLNFEETVRLFEEILAKESLPTKLAHVLSLRCRR